MSNPTETLVKNISSLMAAKGITNVTELAKAVRVPQPTLHRLMAGENQDPKYALLKRLADFFKVTVMELAERERPKETPEGNASRPITRVHFVEVPVVGGAQLGDGGHWVNMQYPVGYGDGCIKWPTADEDAYALRCSGDSMKPRIKDGEFVVVEPNHNYIPGDEVLLVTKDERVMVKTFLYEREGEIMVMSVNEEHLPIKLNLSELEHVHYVAGIAKHSLYVPC